MVYLLELMNRYDAVLLTEVLSFNLTSFFSPRVPSRTPHYIWLSCLLRLLLAVTSYSDFPCFLMTLTVLRRTCRGYRRMPLYWNFSYDFLIIRRGYGFWGGRSQR